MDGSWHAGRGVSGPGPSRFGALYEIRLIDWSSWTGRYPTCAATYCCATMYVPTGLPQRGREHPLYGVSITLVRDQLRGNLSYSVSHSRTCVNGHARVLEPLTTYLQGWRLPFLIRGP